MIANPIFPHESYERIYSTVTDNWASHSMYEHFSGGWTALAYRFHAAVDSGAQFQESIKKFGASPEAQERFAQERAVFDYFSCGFSSFEAAFYGIYAVGGFLKPNSFPLAQPKDQQSISPNKAVRLYTEAFPGNPINNHFTEFLENAGYQEWREIRNVLTHRTAPGRHMYVSIGSDDTPSVDWKLKDIPLNELFVPRQNEVLAGLMTSLLDSFLTFLDHSQSI